MSVTESEAATSPPPRGDTWVNSCYVCTAGPSEPLSHCSLFCGQLQTPVGSIIGHSNVFQDKKIPKIHTLFRTTPSIVLLEQTRTNYADSIGQYCAKLYTLFTTDLCEIIYLVQDREDENHTLSSAAHLRRGHIDPILVTNEKVNFSNSES